MSGQVLYIHTPPGRPELFLLAAAGWLVWFGSVGLVEEGSSLCSLCFIVSCVVCWILVCVFCFFITYSLSRIALSGFVGIDMYALVDELFGRMEVSGILDSLFGSLVV